jgi:hypothetical protein
MEFQPGSMVLDEQKFPFNEKFLTCVIAHFKVLKSEYFDLLVRQWSLLCDKEISSLTLLRYSTRL